MVIPDGFRLQESRPAALENSLVKRGVLGTIRMGWFGFLITRKSQERAKELYDYRLHLEENQSVRSMKLPLGAYSMETSAAVGAWVLLERNDKARQGVQPEGAARTVSWEIQKQAEKNRQSAAGGEH